jgi:hypothetical protein
MAKLNWSNLEEPKRLLAAIVQLSKDRRFENKTNLFKAYYWAHLYYWERHKGTLTRDPSIVRMPNGPGVDGHRMILEELARDGILRIDVRRWGVDDRQDIFTSLVDVRVTPEEEDVIKLAIAKVANQLTEHVSKESHQRAWEMTANGYEMPIYLDALTDEEYERLSKAAERSESDLAGLF